MQGHQPHPATPGGAADFAAAFRPNNGKKRGSYNCGRCGQPKKGHICHLPPSSTAATPTDSTSSAATPISVPRPPRQPYTRLRRALSFEDAAESENENEENNNEGEVAEESDDVAVTSGELRGSCLYEVMRRLAPMELLIAAKVCKGWRDTSRRIWKAAEELRLRVPVRSQLGFAGSVVRKCPGLLRLSLRMERF